MTDFDALDYFTDESLLADPYPYYEHLRAKCPVAHLPAHNVMAVTGYDEVLEVYRDTDTFSSANCVTGPFPGLPVEADGDDISDLLEQYRDQLPMSEYVITQDPPDHATHRSLVMRLLTPVRLRENEESMWRLADHQFEEFIDTSKVELIHEYARPFTALVIADLLGVPEEDFPAFREVLAARLGGAAAIAGGQQRERDPLQFLFDRFTAYVEDRRREPRQDVMTQLATATYQDGTIPEVPVVVRMATFLFGAGQDTTGRLMGSALRIIAERPELQQMLRDNRERIPDFIEEALRIESPSRLDFRLARVTTMLGGVKIPAGTTVGLFLGAANRDPEQFDDPEELNLDRPNLRAHMAFGRGIHSCPGGSLARVETKVTLERIFDRMADIRISEANHGPAGDRHYDYVPSYTGRGLDQLHLEFTPITNRT